MPRQRLILAIVGALAGASLYLLVRVAAEGVLGQTAAVTALVFTGTFFTALLALTGPMELPRAVPRALGQALVVAGLVLWASFRFDSIDGLAGSPLVIVSILVLVLIPLPFILAEDGLGWRDYPALFSAAWGIVMRSTVAWVFVAILWAVIYLSHALLSLVGIDVIERLILMPPAIWLITGTAFGLAMAVALELSDLVSAYLVLRLLRLLLPVVLVVIVVFLVAVASKGIGAALGGLSMGAILLLMAGVAATLVTAAVDQSDAEATANPFLLRATQALAVLLVMPAALAALAVWQRVAAHGWTPDRLFAASVAALALGYGVTYLVAVLRGRGWMARIRQANVWMAVALMVLAALWLTPALNPERISTASQMARLLEGRTEPEALDLHAISQWGRAGSAALAELAEKSKTDPALAKALAKPGVTSPQTLLEDPKALRDGLQSALPVQPATEAGFRDQILALAEVSDLQNWTQACGVALDLGGPGCVLVVADFLPDRPGPEGLLILNSEGGYLTYTGLAIEAGALRMLDVDSGTGDLANYEDGAHLIAELQQALPALRPVTRNELAMPVGGVISLKP